MILETFLYYFTMFICGGVASLFVDSGVSHILDGVAEVDDEYL